MILLLKQRSMSHNYYYVTLQISFSRFTTGITRKRNERILLIMRKLIARKFRKEVTCWDFKFSTRINYNKSHPSGRWRSLTDKSSLPITNSINLCKRTDFTASSLRMIRLLLFLIRHQYQWNLRISYSHLDFFSVFIGID